MKKSFILLGIAALLVACSQPQTERLFCAEADMQSFPFSENGLRVVKLQTITPVEGVE